MKQIILMTLLTVSIHSTPNWVPSKHKKAYDLVIKSAKRLANILRAKATYSDCKVDNEVLILTLTRGDLDTVMELNIKGIKSCKASNGSIEIDIEHNKASFMQCLSSTGIGFGVGFVGGIAACAVIKSK